jgi:hypothetical protein
MGSKINTVDKRFSPSPDAYEITQHTIGKNSSKWGFGSEMRKGVANAKSISPGPGAYVHKSMAFEIDKPKFFMGTKLNPLKANTTVPGAGAYDPKPEATKK